MFAEGDETAREETNETYEPPAIVALGSVAGLTGPPDGGSIDGTDDNPP